MKPMLPMDEIATCPFGTRIDGFERCGAPATVRYADALYCEMHQRLIQMRRMAARDEKAVPTFRQLAMLIPPDMRCPKCSAAMSWRAPKGTPRSRVISLNHMRDGTLSLDCLACNNTHGHATSIVDEHQLPERRGRTCLTCGEVRPLCQFWAVTRRRPWAKETCKTCFRRMAKERLAGGVV